MPYKEESKLMATGGDAPADMTTELCFNPPEGPFDARNVVTGEIGHVGDEDWIAIKLTAGNQYTITVTGTKTGSSDPLDTVLKLMDEKGGEIMMNDDYKDKDGNLVLGSQIVFPPEAGTGTQTYFLSVSGYTGNPVVKNTGTYSVSVKEVATLAVGTGPAISGREGDLVDKLNGTDLSEMISGLGGDDTIYGNGGNDTINGGPGDDFIAGGKGADMITGGDGQDTISYAYSSAGVRINLRAGSASGGDAEGDKLVDAIENVHGSMHDDMLSGSRGVGDRANNKIWGLGGNDELFGDRGIDHLYGGAGDDVLDGGEGDDTLEGGYGADELIGGGDAGDVASYMHSMMGVTVRLHTMQAMGGDAEGDTFGKTTTSDYTVTDEDGEVVEEVTETVPDIANLRGSAHDDVLAGDSRGNKIWGGAGNDTLYGGPSGNDDSGNADELHGEDGHDRIFGGRGDDTLNGGAGNDHLWGNGGADTFMGGLGNDMFYADPSDNFSGAEDNMMGSGMDTISFELLKAAVTDGNDGNDGDGTYTLAANIENLIGTSENDNLTGNNLSNTIEGGDGADMLRGGTNDTDETDTLSYESSDRRVRVDLGNSSASGGHAQGDDIGTDEFMHLIGSAYDDVLTGSNGNNTLKGLAGDDEIIGGDGNDTVEGGAGADEMNGGSPEGSGGTNADGEMDTLSYASSDAGVMVNLAALTASGGHAEGDEIVGERDAYDPDGDEGDKDPVDVATFENVTGSDHDDRLTGDHRMNVLMGGKGNDTLRGLAGADTLHGGPGADTLDGGSSISNPDDPEDNQTQHLDVASYAHAMAGVTVNMDTMKGTAGDAEGDTLVNIEKVVGSNHDDMFIAGSKADNIDGGDSTGMKAKGDTVSYELSEDGVQVDLGARDDSVVADLMNGRDSYAMGDELADIENLTGSNHKDILIGDSGANNTLIGGGGDDQLFGIGGTNHLHGNAGNDTLTGGDGADTLMGGDGRDTLVGGDADDTLNGGAGDDDLSGDGGTDTFVFSPDDGIGDDIINDFEVGTDRIDLSAFKLDATDLAGMISVRGTGESARVVIDLRSEGGGTIELANVTDIERLDEANDNLDTEGVDESQDGVIQELNEYDMTDNADGVFIL